MGRFYSEREITQELHSWIKDERLRVSLQTLERIEKEVLWRRMFLGEKTVEIALRLNVSSVRVGNVYYKALEKMKMTLGERAS